MKKLEMTQEGIDHIGEVEGRVVRNGKHVMYKDVVGLPTIGYGHLLTRTELSTGRLFTGKESISWRLGLTEQQADDLLDRDLDRFENAVNRYVNIKLKQHQFEALVSFAFNVGVNAFKNSTLLKRVNAKNFTDVPNQFMRWVYAGGKRIRGLANRRKSEIDLWNGKYAK